MPVTQKHIDDVLEATGGEGNPVLHVAPTTVSVPGVPKAWAKVLASPNARTDALMVLWDPMARRVPKILRAMKRLLQGIGLLTTDTRPPSLIYFFTLEDEQPHFYRGYVPASKLPPVAKHLPDDFLQFYQIHDGWVNGADFMGPAASGDWIFLGPEEPSNKFLVVVYGTGGVLLGYDLRESPPLCYLLPGQGDPPEIVPKVWARIDRWVSGRMEDWLPYSAK